MSDETDTEESINPSPSEGKKNAQKPHVPHRHELKVAGPVIRDN